MIHPVDVLLNITSVMLIMAVGWCSAKRAILDDRSIATFSHFTMDIAMPALIFSSMLTTVNPEALSRSWYYPLIGMAIIIVGAVVGYFSGKLFVKDDKRLLHSYIFVTAMPNWLLLPLVLVNGLFPESQIAEAERTIILFHFGIMPLGWSMGVWLLKSGEFSKRVFIDIIKTPGLIATLAGILVALFIPWVRELDEINDSATALQQTGHVFYQALRMLGELSLPMALVLTGARIAIACPEKEPQKRRMIAATASRLLIAPIVVLVIWLPLDNAFNLAPSQVFTPVMFMVACMPVALNCMLFTSRYNGDSDFAADTILWSTLLSVLTVPAMMALLQAI